MTFRDLRTYIAARWRWTAVFILVVLVVGAGGFWYYHVEVERIQQVKYEEIAAIGDLTSRKILRWREERLGDAVRNAEDPLLRQAVADFLYEPGAAGLRVILRERLKIEQRGDVYSDVLLLDPKGNILLAAKKHSDPMDPATERAIAAALSSRAGVLSDLYRCPQGVVHIDATAAIRDQEGRLLAVLILRSDADAYLYPLLQSWPTPSPSAETLLVMSMGDEVVYLNKLRHRSGISLSLRQPLWQGAAKSGQAVLGKDGMFQGRDYRGAEVLADLRPIAGSYWLLVSKVDATEILAEARYRARAIAFFALLSILLAAALVAFAYRQRQARLYRNLYQSERKQREVQEEFRTALYCIGDAVITTDKEGRVRQMNPVAEQLTGWPEAEAQGRPLEGVFCIVNEDTRARVENPVQQVLREGLVVGLANHTLLIARDGTEVSIADSAAPIRDEGGAVIGVVLVFRDQTEERAAQRALRESERKLSTLMDNLPGMAYRCRLDRDWTMEFVSEGVFELTGYCPADLVNNARISFTELMHPEDRERVWEEVQAAIAGSLAFTLEYRIRDADGAEKWVWERGCATVDAKGEVDALEGFITDITERKRAEAQLREGEERLAQTFEFLPDATFAIDAQGRVTAWNRAIEDLTGIKAANMLGRGDYAYAVPFYGKPRPVMIDLPLAPDEETARSYAFFREEDRRLVSETYLADFQGRGPTWLWNTASILYGPERQVLGAIESIREITDRKQAEAAREQLEAQLRQAQKMEAVGRLAGGVAHDFNNMLNVIIGYAGLGLMKLDSSDPLQTHIQEIMKAAKRAADLVRQLLAFARRQTIAPRALDLNETVAGMLRMLRRLIGEDIDLLWKPGPDLWQVNMDPTQLDQILANLTVNARDAITGVGKITIETDNVEFDEAYCQSHAGFIPGQYVLLALSDDGCGMDRDVMAHLFEPFFTTKPLGEGTGLGLATVYGIVKQNEGFINVYSEPSKGSTFKIYLPRHRSEPVTLEAPKGAAEAPTGTETVLLVEDEETLLEIGQIMLAHLGYEVLAAGSPLQALRLAEEFQGEIHLLLTDVVMPVMSGRDLWQRLCALRPGLKCLYMSGYTANVIAHRGVLDEGVHFLQKPFSLDALAGKVREALW
ncbi:MAG: PAS domain S-box protein [Smithellaceae bacterium]|nr:PAS domain S-box protein [Smithellaceae bacterium]